MAAEGAGLRGFAKAAAALWFHRVKRRGPPLPAGPVLLVLNHPNGLLDPLLAAALLERPPRFVAKAALWGLAPLRPLLAFFRAIPVPRAQDGEGEDRAQALAESFASIFAAFGNSELIGIFPEGISHAGHDLAPLKTGPARMLLGAPVRPALVPAGLVYADRGVFRHSALLQVGEPIATGDLEGTEPATVLALTERIRAALLPLTLHGPDAEAVRLAQDLAWLLAEGPPPWADLAAFQARVRSLQGWLGSLPEEDREAARRAVARARAWLDGKGLRPDQVGHPYPLGETLRWAPKAFARGLLALLCVPAGLLHWPAYRLVDGLSRRGDLDVQATTKLLAGAVLLPLWSGLLLLAAGWRFGLPGVCAWVAAVPAAWLSLPLLAALREDLRAVRGWRARRDPAVPALLEARAQLRAAVPDLARESALRRPSGTG